MLLFTVMVQLAIPGEKGCELLRAKKILCQAAGRAIMEVFRVCFCSCVNLPFLVWKFCYQVFLDDWE